MSVKRKAGFKAKYLPPSAAAAELTPARPKMLLGFMLRGFCSFPILAIGPAAILLQAIWIFLELKHQLRNLCFAGKYGDD